MNWRTRSANLAAKFRQAKAGTLEIAKYRCSGDCLGVTSCERVCGGEYRLAPNRVIGNTVMCWVGMSPTGQGPDIVPLERPKGLVGPYFYAVALALRIR